MKEKQKTLAEIVESFFIKRLSTQSRASAATLSSYRDALRLFFTFAAERAGKQPSRLVVEDVGSDTVLEFLNYLETKRHCVMRTRNQRLAVIRSFFKHMAYSEPAYMATAQRVISIPGRRTVKKMLGYLTKEELEVLLAVPDRSTPKGKRDFALLIFMARTGARVSETIGINVLDIVFGKHSQVLLRGKGDKERLIPLADDAAWAVKSYLSSRGDKIEESSPLFCNLRGERLSRFGALHILKEAVTTAAQTMPQLAGRSISPHTLRHTTVMHLLQSGVDPNVIRSWLGHVNLDTTHQYVEADIEMKRQALGKGHILSLTPETYKPSDELMVFLNSL
jgi:site-specific recombinase XerD